MPKYQCPECEAILRRDMPIPQGKKVKCPKCEFVFVATPLSESREEPENVKKKAKAVPKAAPPGDEEDEGGSYSLMDEKEESPAEKKKKKDVEYGSLRDKFEKSKRGPAMAILVKLTNGMLLIGVVTVILAVANIMIGLWPFIFSEVAMSGADTRDQIFKILYSIVVGVYGGCMCFAASQMHTLESYRWSIAGIILTSLLGLGIVSFGFVKLIMTMIALNSDPKPPEAEKREAGIERIRGKVANATKEKFGVETGDKKETELRVDQTTEYFKGSLSRRGRSVDLRDGVNVSVDYAKLGVSGTAKKVIIEPSDGVEDDAFTNMLLMLVFLGITAWGGFACTIAVKSIKRLQLDSVKEAFEETQEQRDY